MNPHTWWVGVVKRLSTTQWLPLSEWSQVFATGGLVGSGWFVGGSVKIACCKKICKQPDRGAYLSVFVFIIFKSYIPYLMCCWWARSPLGIMKMITDLFFFFFFAKVRYVMAICQFGVWALSHAVLYCRRHTGWEQLFNLQQIRFDSLSGAISDEGDLFLTINPKRCQSWTKEILLLSFYIHLACLCWLRRATSVQLVCSHQPSHHSGKKQGPCPRNEHVLIRNMHHINIIQQRKECNENKELHFCRLVLCSDATIEVLGHSENHWIWIRSGKLVSVWTLSRLWSTGVTTSCCVGDPVHFTKYIAPWGKNSMEKNKNKMKNKN